MALGSSWKPLVSISVLEAVRLGTPQHAPALVLQAEEDVLRHGERGHELELLVHDGDALGKRHQRVPGARALAEDVERACAGGVVAAEHLAERRLAGAVLADQPVDLARQDVHRDVAEHPDAREGHADAVGPVARVPQPACLTGGTACIASRRQARGSDPCSSMAEARGDPHAIVPQGAVGGNVPPQDVAPHLLERARPGIAVAAAAARPGLDHGAGRDRPGAHLERPFGGAVGVGDLDFGPDGVSCRRSAPRRACGSARTRGRSGSPRAPCSGARRRSRPGAAPARRNRCGWRTPRGGRGTSSPSPRPGCCGSCRSPG